jgi:membrane glycosyltransferase
MKNTYYEGLRSVVFYCIILLSVIFLWFYSHFCVALAAFRFLIFYTVGRIPWTGDQPDTRPLPHAGQQKQIKRTQMHVLSGIRTHDPIVREVEDIS